MAAAVALTHEDIDPKSIQMPSFGHDDIDVSSIQHPNAPGEAQTALEHGVNMATMGYLPQLQAAASKPLYGAFNAITGKNVEPDSYVNERDTNIDRLKQEEETNPKSALAGKIGGTVAGGLLTPTPELGMLGKGILGNAARGGVYGAEYGAASNPGDVKGEVNPTQAGARTLNAAKGLGTGALVGGALGALHTATSPEEFQQAASEKAVKAAGGAKADFKSLNAKNQTGEIGQFALDKGIVKAGDDVEAIAQKANQAKKEAGQKLSSIYSKSTEGSSKDLHPDVADAIDKAGFNPVRDKDSIVSAAKEELGNSVNAGSAVSKLSRYLDNLGRKYGDKTLDPGVANDIKGAMDDTINYSRNPLSSEPDVESAFKVARNQLSQKISDHIDTIGKYSEGSTADALKEANKDYGYSAQLSNMAKAKVAGNEANRGIGLTDTLTGNAAARTGAEIGHEIAGTPGRIAGHIGGGLIGAFGNNTARAYAPAIQAESAQNIANIAEKLNVPIDKVKELLMSNPGLAKNINYLNNRPGIVTKTATQGLLNRGE